jgi:hypothetical protein
MVTLGAQHDFLFQNARDLVCFAGAFERATSES